jgi:hypothetical protein
VERVALAHAVNDEIRRLAERFELPPEQHDVGWFCRCGCFTLVHATVAEYDSRTGRVFAAGHPADESRVAANEAFERIDPSTVLEDLDEELRRKLTEDLARRLERQELARRLERLLTNNGES